MKKLLIFLFTIWSIASFGQSGSITPTGVFFQVLDTASYQSQAAFKHGQGRFDIYWNAQATTKHWDIWNGSSYTHVFDFNSGGGGSFWPLSGTGLIPSNLEMSIDSDVTPGDGFILYSNETDKDAFASVSVVGGNVDGKGDVAELRANSLDLSNSKNIHAIIDDGGNPQLIVTDNTALPTGLVAAADYSATFVDSSYTTKKYVDDAISGAGGGSQSLQDVITVSDVLTAPVAITSADPVSISTDDGAGHTTALVIDPNGESSLIRDDATNLSGFDILAGSASTFAGGTIHGNARLTADIVGGTTATGTLSASDNGSVNTTSIVATPTNLVVNVGNDVGGSGDILKSDGSGHVTWQPDGGGSGTVNSGTSGQLAYYASTGAAVSGTNAGTGILTALGVNIGSAGAVVVNGGALGTPSSGVATNLTGTASGLTAGTVTTNANLTGDVTSTGNTTAIASGVIVNADVNASAAIDATKIADGTVTSSEFQFINTLSSNAQTQIDGKRAISDTYNTQTGSYTLVLTDVGKVVELDVASANNVTVPLNSSVAYPVGTNITIVQKGAGLTSVVATGGVTINTSAGVLTSPGQYTVMVLSKRATNEWYLWNGSGGVPVDSHTTYITRPLNSVVSATSTTIDVVDITEIANGNSVTIEIIFAIKDDSSNTGVGGTFYATWTKSGGAIQKVGEIGGTPSMNDTGSAFTLTSIDDSGDIDFSIAEGGSGAWSGSFVARIQIYK